MENSFAELLRRAATGDEAAWSAFFNQYAPALLGFLRGAGAPEPDDQLSEVFLQVARDIHTFTGDETNFRGWIFTIARNRMLDALRSQNRRPVTPVDWQTYTASHEHADKHAAAQNDEIDAAFDTYRLLEDLEPLERDIIVLRYIADLDTKTVGLIVGKRANTVAVTARRALAKIRQNMNGHGPV
jgi:RNA polymerase sigma-70 factor (ECF subfamily)